MRQGNGMEAVDAERVLHRTKGEKYTKTETEEERGSWLS
jgi:hypothetical protein